MDVRVVVSVAVSVAVRVAVLTYPDVPKPLTVDSKFAGVTLPPPPAVRTAAPFTKMLVAALIVPFTSRVY